MIEGVVKVATGKYRSSSEFLGSTEMSSHFFL